MGIADELVAYADGATGHQNNHTGVGAVLLDGKGHILAWANRRLEQMTNNEAEYAGLVLALEMAARLQPRRLRIYLDSAVVVGQMKGECGVRSATLKPWHLRACRLARRLKQVTYQHIPRERNRLADALAYEALTGRVLEG
jgi:ribonuclease HI